MRLPYSITILPQPTRQVVKYLATFCFFLFLVTCAPSKDTTTPDNRNKEGRLTRIISSYRALQAKKAFSLGYTDREFELLTIDMVTDSLTYIFHFNPNDPAFRDTLEKFGYEADSIIQLSRMLKEADCIWITMEPAADSIREHNYTCLSFQPLVSKFPPYLYRYPVYVFSKKNMSPFKKEQHVGPRKLRRVNDTLAVGLDKYFRL